MYKKLLVTKGTERIN